MKKTPNRLLITAFLLAVVLAATAWYATARKPAPPPSPSSPAASAPAAELPVPEELSKSLLDQMRVRSQTPDAHAGAASGAPSDRELEDAYSIVADLQQRIDELKAETAALAGAGQNDAAAKKLSAAKAQLSELDDRLLSLQGRLSTARAARPDDPIVDWLTGELLMLVGGEPEEILPHFAKAARGGLQRPDALISMARVQLEANQFEAAYQSAMKAVDTSGAADRRTLDVFAGVAIASGHFDEALRRIARAFPHEKPEWAAAIQLRAQALQDEWLNEQTIRRAEEAAGSLPLVRVTIEHQIFGQGADGRSDARHVARGRDDVDLELYPHQAPAAVGNFLKLVQRGFYDGTRFHWAEAASMVVGGDPNSKNDDPADDGLGGPGYVIPDEFKRADARLHFRGSVAMVESAANTAGSQFFIELVPHPEMNHHITVFGRVVRGQEGVDRITAGRTNQRFGRFGKIIPGDLIVKARVIRK